MGDMGEARPGIRSLDSGLRVLEHLRDRPSLSVNEAAKLLGTAPSTAHRVLGTLKARGFVTQDPVSRRYRPGSALLEIAFDALRNLDVRRVSRPHLESLAWEERETVNLIVLERTVIRYVEVVESTEQLRVANRIGETRPAHGTAAGKVLLAALPDDQVVELYPEESLPTVTARTVRTRTAFLEELAVIRQRGYALAVEESIEGLTAVAVALRGPLGNAVGALAVAGPSSRLAGERLATVAEATKRHAAAIEANFRVPGHRP